jgi:hypothetical protein
MMRARDSASVGATLPKGPAVPLLVAILALWLLFAIIGFLIHVLWVIAVILAVGWLFGFAFRRGQDARWYRW